MSVLSVINAKRKVYAAENPDHSSFAFLIHLIQGYIRILSARYYLRKCTKIGKMVSTFKKPVIDNQGEMILGDEVRVWSNIVRAKLYTGKRGRLVVGKNSRLNGVHIDVRELVQIGENVRIAPYTIILDSDFHDLKNHFADGASKPIIIEDNVWIATRSTILKGVTIGEGSVVATGSIVTRDVPPHCVVAGIPAKIIKKLD